ncbi:hypothetical protein OS493_031296 [Desmophyllum pertusum]|uniref:Uncharacterized protein n=1 Tax=Desmophyllum pertusum TaxID=174260 RepID=A0A9X0CUZ5_9CNID|nr:hypothetical protein OS493_031296 [Desmophyllum pertusum]
MKINETISQEIPVDGTFYKSEQRSESLPFSGQLTYEGRMSYIEGNFRTQSVWRKAFGIEYLTMKNLRVG